MEQFPLTIIQKLNLGVPVAHKPARGDQCIVDGIVNIDRMKASIFLFLVTVYHVHAQQSFSEDQLILAANGNGVGGCWRDAFSRGYHPIIIFIVHRY
jgi:hypothetical protein